MTDTDKPLPLGYRIVQLCMESGTSHYIATTDDVPNPRWIGYERLNKAEAINDARGHAHSCGKVT